MDASEARQARALEGIHHSLKELTKIMTAMNENMVSVGTVFKAWLDATSDENDAPRQNVAPLRLTDADVDEIWGRKPLKADPEVWPEAEEKERTEVFTLSEWMNELGRWWNYETVGNMDEIKLTKAEFLNYMSRHGTEMTSQVSEHKQKLGLQPDDETS